MLQILQTYGIAFGTYLVLNMMWSNVAAKDLYQRALKGLLLPESNIFVLLVFYLVFVAALTYFVILPIRRPKDLNHGLIRAAIFGAVCYATYNLTNLATLKDWPVSLVAIDIIWGAVLTTATTGITLILLQKVRKR